MISRLSVGTGTGQKVFTVVFGVFFLGVLGGILAGIGAVLGVFADAPISPAGEPGTDGASADVLLLGAGFLVIVLAIVAAFVTVVLSAFRYAATLEGTTLSVRGAYRTRRVDLSRARTWIYSAAMARWSEPRGIPVLVAEGDGGRVRLRLHDPRGDLLPPHELAALAGAMGDGATARVLRRLAEDPSAHII